MLDVYSKNQEYSDFVKDGIEFLKRVRAGKNGEGRKFYTRRKNECVKAHGSCWCASEEGYELICTMEYAFKKAIRPHSRVHEKHSPFGIVNDIGLQRRIADSRKYMAEFEC